MFIAVAVLLTNVKLFNYLLHERLPSVRDIRASTGLIFLIILRYNMWGHARQRRTNWSPKHATPPGSWLFYLLFLYTCDSSRVGADVWGFHRNAPVVPRGVRCV